MLAAVATLVLVAMVGTALIDIGDGGGGPSRLIASSRLASFDDCGALLDHLQAEARERVGPFGLDGGQFAILEDSASGLERQDLAGSSGAERSAAPTAGADDDAGSGDFSGTNVQEAGIDEPDVVKTDGSVVYALSNGRLYAVEERGTPRLLGSIAVEGATELLLADDRLLVIGDSPGADTPVATSPRAPIGADLALPYRAGVRIVIVDVADPAAMKITDELEVDGQYVSARLVDGVARIVLRSFGPALDFVYPSTDSAAALERAERVNREVVEASTLADWLPSYRTGGGEKEQPAYDCNRTYAPPVFSGFGLLSVLTVDPVDPDLGDTTSVLADGETVYASAQRLYVATSQWDGVSIQTGVESVEPAQRAVVAPSQRTLVHSFDIRGAGAARYLVSGEVRGGVLNQFSMSEHKGDLRVATTDQTADGGSQSYVTVLTDDGEQLVQTGQVGGLGKGEQIYAVRFLGDRGYVVTFRQTDPLYVLDLADPADPRVTGELKIPGYSAYLHPIEGDLLIGIGQDATDQGRRLGSQVSLFDVSDPANPTRLQQRALGPASSPAEFDHHAFLHWTATDLTVIPVQSFNNRSGVGSNFAIGLRILPAGIEEVGRVQHPASTVNGASEGSRVPFGFSEPIERSFVIGTRLVTFSFSGLLSSDLATLAPGTWVPFR